MLKLMAMKEGLTLKMADFQNDSVIKHLQSLDNMVYRADQGNLGDMVIAWAQNIAFEMSELKFNQLLRTNTIEVINRKNWISFSRLIQKPFDFVYGGGGIWNMHYNHMKLLKMYACHRNMRSFTVLPSSFWQCDEALKSFDSRFTVFCRDQLSYDYCTSMNHDATFILHDDVAFWLDGMLPEELLSETIICQDKLKQSFNDVQQFLCSCKSFDVANFIRTDAEKTDLTADINVFDISHVYGAAGLDISPIVAKHGTMLMMHAIKPFKKIVTNRLHAAITAALMGKEVEMHDNDYGKLGSVWNMSMLKFNNVVFINENHIV